MIPIEQPQRPRSCGFVWLRAFLSAIQLPNQAEHRGELTIADTRENSLNRILKLAQHVSRFGAHETVYLLYESQLLWMNEDRFVLTGFERVGEGANAADYVQSWLCKLGTE